MNHGHTLKQRVSQAKSILKDLEKVVVAFSGGVDSTLLLRLSLDVLGKENVLAVTASSPTFLKEELKEAAFLAKKLGASWLTFKSKEFKNPKFRENPPNRCYYCKKELFSQLKSLAREKGYKNLADGNNADDFKDYRPGLKALKELGVRSPLAEAGLKKEEIRELAKNLGLPNYAKPSLACLASRFPYYTPLTLKDLKKVAEGESFLRKLGFSQIRLRHHGNLARVEICPQEFSHLLQNQSIREQLISFLSSLGYVFVTLDLEGYQSGSLNKTLQKLKPRKAKINSQP